MNTQSERNEKRPLKPIRTVREVMDEEWMTNGDGHGKVWTREELTIHHRIGDLLDEKTALGYTIEEINAEWQGKTSEEILAAEAAKKVKPRTRQKRTVPQAMLNKMP